MHVQMRSVDMRSGRATKEPVMRNVMTTDSFTWRQANQKVKIAKCVLSHI